MAEVTRKRVGELARGVFTVLLPHPEGLAARVVLERMWAAVPPTEFERQNYPANPDVRRYEKMVRFATISSVKAGWLQKNRGLWSLTDEGRTAHLRFQDPYEFIREAGRLYKKWKAEQPPSFAFEDEGQDLATEAEEAATTLEEAEESAWSEIETHLSEMNPYDFQQVVAGLLRAMGYHVSWVAPPGPDRGIDVIAHSYPLGVTGPRIKVQVKRTAERIAAREVRSFFAVVADVDVGLFISTGGFTKDAEEETRTQERRRVMLLDLRRFFDLWVENYARVPEQTRRLLPLRPVYFLALAD